jgi:hypothetical protein
MRRCMHILEPHAEIQSIPYFSVSRCNGHYGRDLVRFHAEDNQILLADVGDTTGRCDGRDDHLAVFQQRKTVLDNARQMRAAGDDPHILARMGKFGRQEAADRASADYADLHE